MKTNQKKTRARSGQQPDHGGKRQANFRLPEDLLELLENAAEATDGRASQAEIIEMCVSLLLDPAIKRLGEDALRRRDEALAKLKAKHGEGYKALFDRAVDIIMKAGPYRDQMDHAAALGVSRRGGHQSNS